MVQSRAAETPDGDDDSATNKKAEACDFSSLSVEEKAVRLYAGEALAPMVRASTIPLRSLALKYGADFCYTEELIDRSISSTIRVENKVKNTVDFVKDSSRLSKKQQRRLQQKNESPALILQVDPKLEARRLVCQLGTGEPQLALTAAMHVHRDVSAIDINMGWYVWLMFRVSTYYYLIDSYSFYNFYLFFLKVPKNSASLGAWDPRSCRTQTEVVGSYELSQNI